MRLKPWSLMSVLVGSCVAASAVAAPITVQLNGSISSASASQSLFPAELGTVSATQPFSLIYTIESSTSGFGTYNSAITAMQIVVNGNSFTLPTTVSFSSSESVQNNIAGGMVDLLLLTLSGCNATNSGCYEGQAQFSQSGNPPNALTSNALVTVVNPTLFNSNRQFTFTAYPAGLGNPTGSQDFVATFSGQPQVVPVPAALWLLLSGIGGVGATLRRRRMTR